MTFICRGLRIAAAAFAESPAKGVVHGDYLFIDSDDRTIGYQYGFDFNLNQFKYEGYHIWSQAMFWRREVHERFGGFDPRLHKTMDYQMILEFGINEGKSAFPASTSGNWVFPTPRRTEDSGLQRCDLTENIASSRIDIVSRTSTGHRKRQTIYLSLPKSLLVYKAGGDPYLLGRASSNSLIDFH